jgi:hypothetical protein
VRECVGTDCLLPTLITYRTGQPGISAPTVSAGSSPGIVMNRAADVNGDGREDIVYAVASGANRNWFVKLAGSAGFGGAIGIGATTTSDDDVLMDDFLGKGTIDMLAPSGGVWVLYHWNGSSFTATNTGLAIDPTRMIGTLPTSGRGYGDVRFYGALRQLQLSVRRASIQRFQQ